MFGAAEALVTAGRLVSLVGPGGVGKTRLAVETAHRLLDRFGDGVWFCDLAAVSDRAAVPAAVADTVGARPQSGMDLVEAIGVFLERRRCLVILDNCEHVLDAVAVLARQLLGRDGVAVLATSREQIGRARRAAVAGGAARASTPPRSCSSTAAATGIPGSPRRR